MRGRMRGRALRRAVKLTSIASELQYGKSEGERLTHQLFRYPAKFHPPVARALLERYTAEGNRVLDCFCGSGTLLVEAAVAGRHAVGVDVDPVAAFVSQAKTTTLDNAGLRRDWKYLAQALDGWCRTPEAYEQLQWEDISERDYERGARGLALPAIPNLHHWFRRYVLLDLARLKRDILALQTTSRRRAFFLLCFASIIRSASNADPVPVSGLEVTSHMKRRDADGRVDRKSVV